MSILVRTVNAPTMALSVAIPGDRVRVVAYGDGATREDVGRTGIVHKVNRTRIVVRFDRQMTGARSEAAISGGCLILVH